MTIKMLKKFDKYCGKLENINQMLLIATVLDPRYKLDYLEHCFGFIYHDDEIASSMTKSLKTNLMYIYDWYMSGEVTSESSQLSTDVDSKTSGSGSCIGSGSISTSSATSSLILGFKKKQATEDCVEIKNDVQRYLLKPCEDIEDEDFNILNWWRVNGSKYRVLSKLARDIFAIQVSTVASESAFSSGKRILDPFRSSLTPKMVETLVCTQNWLKTSPNMDRFYMENVEYYENLDAGNTTIYMQLKIFFFKVGVN